MNKNALFWAASLLALSALSGCSEKTVNAPAAAVLGPVPVAAPAPVAVEAEKPASPPKTFLKSATMECPERNVVLEASCVDLYGPGMLQCTSQNLTVMDAATGAKLGTRAFVATKGEDDAGPATVEEKIDEMSCVTTEAGEKYIVTNISNGGNCEQCEWREVYGWDGVLKGSTRDKKRNVQVKDALYALDEPEVDRMKGTLMLDSFYSATEGK